MDKNVVLAILCGLPGSGKTYLSTLIAEKVANDRLLKQKGKIECKVVCYDEWLPVADVDQFSDKLSDNSKPSVWKESRKSIRQATEQMIADVKDRPCLDLDIKFTKLIQDFRNELQNGNSSNVIFIIDDNMHLKSMRFEYFQLARKYNVGYCQIYVKCDRMVALSRNSSRVGRVPDAVIHEMADRFEAPQPQKNSWERFSLVMQDDADHSESCWHDLASLLQDAFNYPVPPLEDNESEKSISREMCAASVLHQADQALRKLLSEAMQKHAEGDSSGRNLKQLSLRLNTARQHVLNGIKMGKIGIPNDILVEVESGNVTKILPQLKAFLKKEMDRLL